YQVEKDMEKIAALAKKIFPPLMEGYPSFKVEAKRSDKRFPFTSPQIMQKIGGLLAQEMPHIHVDVMQPAIICMVEIREKFAYLHAGQSKGACGMPLGSNGRGLLLLSGGIDSPVAGFMMAKRGVEVEALHFESFPYTSERAKEKVKSLASILCRYTDKMRFHCMSFTEIQLAIKDNCDEEYFTLLLRRFMMRLSQRCAKQFRCRALITGESIGQVASQTMMALGVTDAVVSMPVFRPCIGMDKEEIITIARKVHTFDT
ncbi:MAG TPA: tRNA 4-thiouridine(8) synthase ThiI, partial [Clostridiales bacterium]|nr:tRNA 4-thiouridine(8) synthase ThiI [Clostridiales bacterium]